MMTRETIDTDEIVYIKTGATIRTRMQTSNSNSNNDNLPTQKKASSKAGQALIIIVGLLLILIIILLIFYVLHTTRTQQELFKACHGRIYPFDTYNHLSSMNAILASHLGRQLANDSSRSLVFEPSLGEMHILDNCTTKPNLDHIPETQFDIYTWSKRARSVGFRKNKAPTIDPKQRPCGRLNMARDFQYDLEAMGEGGFEVGRGKTVIMIPGFIGPRGRAWVRKAVPEWLNLHGQDVNVIVVEWPLSGATTKSANVANNYSEAVASSMIVARQVTIFMHYLAQLSGTDLHDQEFLSRIHLVGHSLGAHIAGFVGKDLGGRVGRITGLDPAGPLFASFHNHQRLFRSDAQLVEVLHTNAGKLIRSTWPINMESLFLDPEASTLRQYQGLPLGIDAPLGHIDYYANNGSYQEDCFSSVICHHERAGELFVERLVYAGHLEHRRANHSSGGTTAGRQAAEQDAKRRRDRLWAFRAADYETFEAGGQFSDHCSQMMQVLTHLNNRQMAKTIGHCAVPLLDLVTPVDDLIQELHNEFRINFDHDAHSSDQPLYYFKTSRGAPSGNPNYHPNHHHHHLMSDHYLLKLYLDPDSTQMLHNSRCTLKANLHFQAGQERATYKLQVTQFSRTQKVLALPFAHPSGVDAHLDLEELLSLMAMRNRTFFPLGRAKQLIARLFPQTIELQTIVHEHGEGNHDDEGCQLTLRDLEVHPISVDTPINVALIGGFKWPDRQEHELLGANEFAEHLANAFAPMITLGQGESNKRTLKLAFTLVDRLL